MIRRPPRSTLFPSRRSSDLTLHVEAEGAGARLRWELDVQPDFWVPPLIGPPLVLGSLRAERDRKSTRLNSSHSSISYAVFCLKKKKKTRQTSIPTESKSHLP